MLKVKIINSNDYKYSLCLCFFNIFAKNLNIYMYETILYKI